MSDSDQATAIQVSGSLGNRLAVTLIGGVAVLTLLVYFVVRDYATQIAQQSQDSILRASVTSMLDTAIIRNGIVEMDIPYASFSMLSTGTDDRVFYAIFQDDTLLSGYEGMALHDIKFDSGEVFISAHYNDVPVRQIIASRTLIGAGMRTQITATIAQTQDSLSGILSRISRNAAVYGAGFFSVAVLLSVWVTSSTIKPLKRLAGSVARRGPQDLSPVAQPVPLEMVPLVSSFNHLMTRLERSFSQSEEFIAEAAHRVRTPLSTVRSYAETTLQRVDKEENRQAVRSMIRAIDESSRAATQLLDHAMITFRANQLEYHKIDLTEIVREIVQRLKPLAEMKDVELQLDTEPCVMVSGDPILIQNAVRNIIDNALKYSPIESTISITVTSSPSPGIEVRDEGSGFPLDEIEKLTHRFARGSNSSGTIGSGLGLTIAQDVAVAHEGNLCISNGKQGGACVIFSL
ncbi:MAG: sensor histidine kinase N-terminal domain-containing protein [Granulosicoccus sp.]